MPYGAHDLEIEFDFIDHLLRIALSNGNRREIALAPQTVAQFYARLMTTLHDLGIEVKIWPMPVEIPNPIRFDQDRAGTYDAVQAQRFWHVLRAADTVLKEFRARFIGKCSPVQFFWGSFDLAVTRFSGRTAPPKPQADRMTREAYSHEVCSAGFWPGSGSIAAAAFYCYTAPEPEGFRQARVRPGKVFYSPDFGLFAYRYDDMRAMPDPHAAVLDFLQSTYEAGANLAAWDRRTLERQPP